MMETSSAANVVSSAGLCLPSRPTRQRLRFTLPATDGHRLPKFRTMRHGPVFLLPCGHLARDGLLRKSHRGPPKPLLHDVPISSWFFRCDFSRKVRVRFCTVFFVRRVPPLISGSDVFLFLFHADYCCVGQTRIVERQVGGLREATCACCIESLTPRFVSNTTHVLIKQGGQHAF